MTTWSSSARPDASAIGLAAALRREPRGSASPYACPRAWGGRGMAVDRRRRRSSAASWPLRSASRSAASTPPAPTKDSSTTSSSSGLRTETERQSEIRIQLRLDPGHPAAKEIFQQRDLGGVGTVLRRILRPDAEVSIRGVTDLGGQPVDDAVEVVGREFLVQHSLEARPIS